MSDKNYEYECALSGLTAPGDIHFDDDGLADQPPLWIEVKMTRRVINPRWALVQQVKAAMLEGLAGQFPENVREQQSMVLSVQLDAQFYAMEQDIPPYFTTTEVVYLAPPELSEEVHEAVNEVRDMLGMPPIDLDAGSDDDDDDNDEGEAQAPAQIQEKTPKKLAEPKPTLGTQDD